MTLQAAIKDTVTAFEVYLERALDELLHAHDLALVPRRTSLQWRELRKHHASLLDVELESLDIKEIRAVRHVLTHRRGELRTEQLERTTANTPTGCRTLSSRSPKPRCS